MSDLQNLFGDSSTDLVTQLRTKHYNTINVIRKFLLGEIAGRKKQFLKKIIYFIFLIVLFNL